ncbi:MAG: radical SAM protein [Dehalococcoidia bacterium]
MNDRLVFLCDLTHTSQGYAAELTPYPVACIKAWIHEYSRHGDTLEVELFKHPQRFIDAFIERRPAIVGFSNYMWNLDLSYSIATEIKTDYPETVVIFGGPNYPLEDHNRENWLKAHPNVDSYIIGEGEEPFTNFVDDWYESRDIEQAVQAAGSGCHAVIDGQFLKSDDVSPRVSDLDKVPSPYLEGYLDEFLKEVPLTPLLETNRGCPFTCTFCVDGISDRTKVYRKSIDRFEQELEYVAQRYGGKVLTLADLNFGMYKQDIDASRAIAKVKTEYDYPYHLQVSTGKNQKERVLDCAEILDGSLRLAASVQTLDAGVLKNIKRQNISAEKLIEVTKVANRLNANSYSEVILGLPGDTKAKHFDTVFQLADAGLKFIPLYTLMLLEGTVLATDEERGRWDIGTQYRVVPRCFGVYEFKDRQILSAEFEEVCVYTNTLPHEDYLECRSLALTMGLFYQDRILFELYGFLGTLGINPSSLLSILHERRMSLSPALTDLFDSFDQATASELWEDLADLEEFAKTDPETIDRYVNGELGNNVLFRHRAIALLDLVDDIHSVAFEVAREIVEEADPDSFKENSNYLDQLHRFSVARKRNMFELGTEIEEEFTYDFRRLVLDDFSTQPSVLSEPLHIRFSQSSEQVDMINDQIAVQGGDLNGIAKVVSRIPVAKLQRLLTYDDSSVFTGSDDGVQFASPTALSPGEFT